MDVMQGEVNRVLQLCDSSVVPVTWQVPRKSYRDYHADIYPETNGYEAMMGPDEWHRGDNTPVPKISLDPKKRPKEVLTVYQGPLAKRKCEFQTKVSQIETPVVEAKPTNGNSNNGHSNHAEVSLFKRHCCFTSSLTSSRFDFLKGAFQRFVCQAESSPQDQSRVSSV